MSFSKIVLEHFRRFARAEFYFSPAGITLMTGPNGSGKSTILEAVYLLCMGRNSRDVQLPTLLHRSASQMNSEMPPAFFRVTGDRPGGLSRRSVSFLSGSGVAYHEADQPARRIDWIGRPGVVIFSSGEIRLITGEPAIRRKWMDRILSQEDPEYLARLRRYTRTLEERNALLKSNFPRPPDPGAWLAVDETLAQDGDFLVEARRRLVEGLVEQLPGKMKLLGSSLLAGRIRLKLMESAQGNLLQSLLDHRHEDLACGHTTVGPHRDDLLFLDFLPEDRPTSETSAHGAAERLTRPASADVGDVGTWGRRAADPAFAAANTLSQGEIRILALAMKFMEVARLRQRSAVSVPAPAPPVEPGTASDMPIILLDDLFSELDETRRAAACSFICEYPGQVLLTSCLQSHPDLSAQIRQHIVLG